MTDDSYVLLVLHGETANPYALVRGKELVIGRAPEADIRVDVASVSRKHAAVRVGHHAVEIRDLGSDNGTVLRSGFVDPDPSDPHEETRRAELEAERLLAGTWVPLQPGRVVELGSAVAILQRRPAARPAASPRRASPAAEIVVEDPSMTEVYALVERIAVSPISVLVLGETGTGKEVVAEAIWKRSPRAKKPYVKINCAAFAEQLLESELFGHERGAFTGAVEAKAGLFEAAHEGTLFLDEVGELPLSTQVKLLRVLEDREVRRIGSTTPRRIDVRFVAATNRDLEEAVASGRFRSDLLYRINGISLRIPPLRERRAEIVPLAESFLARFATLSERAVPRLDSLAVEKLLAHHWPGNVRELRNVMERALLYAPGDVIEARHVDLGPRPSPTVPPPAFAGTPPTGLTDAQREERDRIVAVLAECAGNQTHAARKLGIARGTLVSRLELYDIPRPRK